MKSKLYVLIDLASFGIIAVDSNKYIIDAIASGLMDVTPLVLYDWDQDRITENGFMESIVTNTTDLKMDTNKTIMVYNDVHTDTYKHFKEKKTVAAIRRPYYEFLIEVSDFYYTMYNFGFNDQNYTDAEEIASNEDMLEKYSNVINSNTHIAKQELVLDATLVKKTRNNVFIAFNYYLKKINELSTKEELDPIMGEIRAGFIFGHNYE